MADYTLGPTGYFFRVTTAVSGGVVIDGFTDGFEGRQVRLVHVGVVGTDPPWTIKHESPAGTAANRVRGARDRDVVLYPGDIVDMIYDGTLQRWFAWRANDQIIVDTPAVAPAALTVNPTNDWAIGPGTFFRITSSISGVQITGITGGVDGRRIVLQGVGTFGLTFIHDATSIAANRFICPMDKHFVLSPDESVELIYNATRQRWMVIDRTDQIAVDEKANVLLNTVAGVYVPSASPDGHLWMQTMAARPTVAPALAPLTGMTAILMNDAGMSLHAYMGGGWHDVGQNTPGVVKAITTSVVDYDIGAGSYFIIENTGSYTCSGFTGGTDGRRIRLLVSNAGNYTFQLRHEAATSAAANRLYCPESKHVTLRAGEMVDLMYVTALGRWVVWRCTDPLVVDIADNVFLNASGGVLATTATDGFICLPSCPGVPTGVVSGNVLNYGLSQVPIVIDSTNFRLYAYISGAWRQL